MKEFYILVYFWAVHHNGFVNGRSTGADKCFFFNQTRNTENEKLINRISSLVGQRFTTQKDGYNYVVGICCDVSKDHEFASVIRTKGKDDTVVIGRRNSTLIIGGDSWLVLNYGNGNVKSGDKKCLDQRNTSVYLICKPHHTDQPRMELVEEDGCTYRFIIPTSAVCSYDEEMSGMKIFFVILAVFFTAYCLLGITYKRLVHNAQGCQHIPHFKFWNKIGNTFADACNYVCKCDSEPEDSWNNITSNFDSGDRDDALLRP